MHHIQAEICVILKLISVDVKIIRQVILKFKGGKITGLRKLIRCIGVNILSVRGTGNLRGRYIVEGNGGTAVETVVNRVSGVRIQTGEKRIGRPGTVGSEAVLNVGNLLTVMVVGVVFVMQGLEMISVSFSSRANAVAGRMQKIKARLNRMDKSFLDFFKSNSSSG